jgi:hypothetical protein
MQRDEKNKCKEMKRTNFQQRVAKNGEMTYRK